MKLAIRNKRYFVEVQACNFEGYLWTLSLFLWQFWRLKRRYLRRLKRHVVKSSNAWLLLNNDRLTDVNVVFVSSSAVV